MAAAARRETKEIRADGAVRRDRRQLSVHVFLFARRSVALGETLDYAAGGVLRPASIAFIELAR